MAVPLRLKLGRREFFSGGGFSGSFAPISVKLQNIAFQKDAAVHYTPDGANWKDADLAFDGHFGDYDVFKKEVNEQVLQFVIRYTVSGSTFFDNNAGQNYRLDSRLVAVGGNVVLEKATARRGTQAGGGFVFTTSWVEGEILVSNLGFAKQVGIRLTVDGGASWQDVQGSFAGTQTASGTFIAEGAEVWRFKSPELNLNEAVPEFRFAVFYHHIAGGVFFGTTTSTRITSSAKRITR